jgi:peptide deformylase
MEILKFPNKNLFEACKAVTVFEDELKTLLESMWELMIAKGGLGLAANQVGLNYRMFVMAGKDNEKLFIVNPILVQKSVFPANMKEGCLSAPGEFLRLSDRASWVQVQFHDEKGNLQRRVFQDLHAVCAQHEMDHLDGKSHLMSNSIPKVQRRALAKKWGLRVK